MQIRNLIIQNNGDQDGPSIGNQHLVVSRKIGLGEGVFKAWHRRSDHLSVNANQAAKPSLVIDLIAGRLANPVSFDAAGLELRIPPNLDPVFMGESARP